MTLLDRVLERFRIELDDAGKTQYFECFKEALIGDAAVAEYDQAAAALGITPAAAKQASYRMRRRYRQMFREEVGRTVADEADVDDEIGRLLRILGE